MDPTTVAPVVTNVGRRLLGVTAGWELFGRGLDDVVRIQLAKGRIIRTAVPPLLSSGPVSFVVGPHRVLVNPLDLVPGYVVPDGRPARRLTGVLNRGGVVLPGPMPDEVWVQSGAGTQGTMTLVGLDGVRTSTTIRLPRDSALFPSADGAGYVIVTGTGGVYDARPGGFTRITTGTVLAVGPTRWLTLECNGVHHCANVVIDRVGGTRHTLPGPAADAHAVEGVISPDGSTAAVIDLESAGRPELYLRDLRTGRQHRVSVRIDDMALDGSNVAWSPDSRWLFVTSVGGRLGAVDARTRQVHTFGASLGPILALGIRRAP